MLQIDIEKQLGRFHLHVSLDAQNCVTGLLGASGCGKSMTLKCIAGIETPDHGRIVLDGRVLFDSTKRINLTPQERRVGYLFQNYALFPNMTVTQNIAAGTRERDKLARAARVEQLMQSFYLDGMADKLPHQLSGGQQQRVALARILAGEPSILMLDEPFSALDSYLKWKVELELMDLLAAFPGTGLLVTHDRDAVYRRCRSVWVLNGGRSEPIQPVRELFDTPRTMSSCLLSGCKNFSRARALSDGTLSALDWGVTLRTTQPVAPDITHIGYRAHFIQPADATGENRILCRVSRVVEEPFATVVMLTTPGGHEGFSLLRMELPKEQWAALRNPTELYVALQPEHILLLSS